MNMAIEWLQPKKLKTVTGKQQIAKRRPALQTPSILPTLSFADIKDIWNNDADIRNGYIKRAQYYSGQQAILDVADDRIDGRERSKVVTNFIEYGIAKHVGFILYEPPELTPAPYIRGTEKHTEVEKALKNYDELSNALNLDRQRREHLENAILYGMSVSLHSWSEDNGISTTVYTPINWGFMYDIDGQIVVAVYRWEIPKGTWDGEKISKTGVTFYTAYDSRYIYTYKVENGRNKKNVPVNAHVTTNWTEHMYGRVPIAVYPVLSSYASFITPAIMRQQDIYNEVRSYNADDVKYNVDAVLAITGMPSVDALLEENEAGETFAKMIKDLKLLPLLPGGYAEFLTKGNNESKVAFDLDLTRSALHRMLKICDIDAILGATGQASGIALKLKLQPQIEQTGTFKENFSVGIREEIDLFNVIWHLEDKPLLSDFDITFFPNIPVNEIELYAAMPSLEKTLSLEDRIKLIPKVRDSAEAAKAKRREMLESRIPVQPEQEVEQKHVGIKFDKDMKEGDKISKSAV